MCCYNKLRTDKAILARVRVIHSINGCLGSRLFQRTSPRDTLYKKLINYSFKVGVNKLYQIINNFKNGTLFLVELYSSGIHLDAHTFA